MITYCFSLISGGKYCSYYYLSLIICVSNFQVQKIEEDRNSVDNKVKLIQKVLRAFYERNKNQPISFFQFILHPNDFTATVENIFHLCFMIRDGLVRLGEFLI